MVTSLLVLGAELDACVTQDEIRTTAHAYGTDAESLPAMGHNMMLELGWAIVADSIDGWLGEHGRQTLQDRAERPGNI